MIKKIVANAVLSALVLVQTSCIDGKLDPFDFQNGLTREEVRGAIVKKTEESESKNNKKQDVSAKSPALLSIPKTVKLIASPPPPVIGGSKTISFSVTDEVPLKDVLIELGRAAEIDVDLDPKISGGVIINAKNRPLKEVIDRICSLGNLRYSFENGVLHFERDQPFMKNYFVDYLIDGQLWGDVETNIDSILSSIAETSGASTEEGSSPVAQSSFSSNKSAGLISVFATEKEHKMIEKYLADVEESASAQVIIEAKIIEVKLSETFKAGINWTSVTNNITSVGGLPSSTTGGVATGTIKLFSDSVKIGAAALETFGTTRTVASPRLHAINNQKASLNFADTKVYFKIDSNQNVTTTTGSNAVNTASITTTKQELDVGTQLDITPSINPRTKEIVMKITPKLSVEGEKVVDPASSGNTYTDADGNTKALINEVPQVNSRTIETIAKIRSGEVIVIGGLMRDTGTNTDTGVPFLSSIPILGWLFKSSSKESNITETVIFIKATIVERGRGTGKDDRDLQRKFDTNRRQFF